MNRRPTRWRVPPSSELRWRSWDGEYVVYHCDSGHTHRLNLVAAEALRSLEDREFSAEVLVRRVAEALGIEANGSFTGRVERLLEDFHEWGLVERIDAAEGDPESGAF